MFVKDGSLKQIEAVVEELYASNTFNIKIFQELNQGFELVRKGDSDMMLGSIYDFMVGLASRLAWSVNKIPYYIEYNSTVAKAIMVEPRGTYVLNYDMIQGKAEVRPFNVTRFIPPK